MFRRKQNQVRCEFALEQVLPSVRVVGVDKPSPSRKEKIQKKDGAKHWTARTDDVPGDGSTAGWNATTGQLPATFVPSAAAVQLTSTTADPTAAAAATTTKSIPAFSA